ncbi:MAG: hypothetical protein IJW40_01565 [Clostridia bacterium]|nr:hypothetical protein [Clostridia bacterium]
MSEKNDVGQKSKRNGREALAALMAQGKLEMRLRAYLDGCHGDRERDGAFPNLAGFCRYLGVGMRTFCSVGEEYPAIYDAVMTQLEDEALNSKKLPADSAMLTAAYLKRRLGYDGEAVAGKRSGEEVRVVFEHDLEQAGV